MKIILGERIYLRELNSADASEEYRGWLNDPEVNKYLETRSSTIEELKAYIQIQADNQNSFFIGIFDKENNNHIGNVKLELGGEKTKKADFGILIGNKKYWGKGIGPEATKLAVDYAFGSLGAVEVRLGVIRENKRAIEAFKKSGFKAIKIIKKHVNHDGTLFDQIIMSISNKNL